MRDLSLILLNISGQAALIFMVLLAVRGIFALGRIPKKYAYVLWAILFIRLLLPLQVESGWGLMPRESGLVSAVESVLHMAGQEDPSGQTVRPGQPAQGTPSGQTVYPMIEDGQGEPEYIAGNGSNISDVPSQNASHFGQSEQTRRQSEGSGNRESAVWAVCVSLWAVVCAALWCHGLFSWLRIKKQLCCSIPLEGWGERVYLADGIGTPFVLGLTAPVIYLPSDMEQKNFLYVIAHERTHIRRRDYLIKLGAYLIACVYWFHPLVWAGFALMCRDMEMSCDEAVLALMGRDCRGEYADSLVRLTCGNRYSGVASLPFGEGDTKGRVRHIMTYKKSTAVVGIAAVVIIVVLAVVLLTSPGQRESGDNDVQLSLSEEVSSEEQGTSEPDSTVEFQVEYEEIPCPAAVRTGYTSLGADGAMLDYADAERLIFHGYFGLYVYSVSAGQITDAVDLQTLGCGYTQGDNTCQVLVAEDGASVYFYPLGHIAESEGSFSCYVYEVSSGRLLSLTYAQQQTGKINVKEDLQRLTGEKLSGSIQQWSTIGWSVWEQGFCSDSGILFEENGEQVRGYLKSASDTLEDMVYVRERGYTEEGGSRLTEAVQLFGAEGSSISYGQQSPFVTIDGVDYNMDQIIAEYRFGDEVEMVSRPIFVSAIMGVRCVDGLWIVEGHISPDCSTYSIYDPAERKWEEHIIASYLTWSNRDENLAVREENRMDTVIYSLYNGIYSLADGQLAVLDTGTVQVDEENLPREYIIGLGRAGDEIYVTVRSTQTEEERTLEFSYEDARRGVLQLE
ncbi:MAG: hypothetical protein HDR02_07375 [Lachnospiraceae bacterium]|nr:hypothetical protein [Lachnospiraceae bacterium]